MNESLVTITAVVVREHHDEDEEAVVEDHSASWVVGSGQPHS
jgi:hypothetical protein